MIVPLYFKIDFDGLAVTSTDTKNRSINGVIMICIVILRLKMTLLSIQFGWISPFIFFFSADFLGLEPNFLEKGA